MWLAINMQNMRYLSKAMNMTMSPEMHLKDIDSTSLQINMVIPYIFESRLRVKENAWKCVNHTADYGNRCGRYYQAICSF